MRKGAGAFVQGLRGRKVIRIKKVKAHARSKRSLEMNIGIPSRQWSASAAEAIAERGNPAPGLI